MKASDFVLTFGQHKGKTLNEVPLDYVQWMSQQREIQGSRTLPEQMKKYFDSRISKLKSRWTVSENEITATLPDGRVLHVAIHIHDALLTRSPQAPTYEQVFDPSFFVDKPWPGNIYIENEDSQTTSEYWHKIGISRG